MCSSLGIPLCSSRQEDPFKAVFSLAGVAEEDANWRRCLFPADVSEMLRSVARFAHLVSDTIVQGSATTHMVPVDQAECECPLPTPSHTTNPL